MHAATTFPVTEAYRGMRLDRFLQCMLPRMSRASIQHAIGARVTLASGLAVKAARRLAVGDRVTIGQRGAPVRPAVPVPELERGCGWVVVDKPAGIASTPCARRPGEDVASMLQLAPAHRLDRFTSGCLLLTSDRRTARALHGAFLAQRIEKEYLAVVHGEPMADQFEIDAPLGLAPVSRVTGKVGVVAGGQPATTCVEVLVRRDGRALVRVQPRTGRRHQVRAHLAHAGHAIVGDLLYGDDERAFIRWQRGQRVAVPPGLVPGRHLLHAHCLRFPEPSTQAPCEVRAPWPADFGFRADEGPDGSQRWAARESEPAAN